MFVLTAAQNGQAAQRNGANGKVFQVNGSGKRKVNRRTQNGKET